MKVVLLGVFVQKLESIAQDIKVYINIYASENIPKGIPEISDEDMTELVEIRAKLKKLTAKLRQQLERETNS